jgi:hypothetical protein
MRNSRSLKREKLFRRANDSRGSMKFSERANDCGGRLALLELDGLLSRLLLAIDGFEFGRKGWFDR